MTAIKLLLLFLLVEYLLSNEVLVVCLAVGSRVTAFIPVVVGEVCMDLFSVTIFLKVY